MKTNIFSTIILLPLALLVLTVAGFAQWHSAPAFRETVSGVIADSSGNSIWIVGHDGGSYATWPNGRFWNSSDNGLHWSEIQQSSLPGYYDGYRIYFNPPVDANADTLCLALSDGFLAYRRSTNHGVTWDAVNLPGYSTSNSIVISPWNHNLWLSVILPEYLMRSMDAGARWDTLSMPPSGVYTISFDPYRENTLYGVTSGRQGLYESDDNGLSWRVLFNNLTAIPGHTPIVSRVAPLSNGTLIVLCRWDDQYHLASSEDHGQSWNEMNLPSEFQLINSTVVVEDRSVSGQLFLSGYGQSGVLQSLDFGRSWYPVYGGLPVASDSARVLYRQEFSGHLYLALRGEGLFRSTDHGEHWNPIETPYGAAFHTYQFSFHESGITYYDEARPDSEWLMQPSSNSWRRMSALPVQTDRLFLPSYSTPALYSRNGALFRWIVRNVSDTSYAYQIGRAISTDSGQTWDTTYSAIRDTPIQPIGRVSNTTECRLYGLTSDPYNYGTNVWISDDLGLTWNIRANLRYGDNIPSVTQGDTALFVWDNTMIWAITDSVRQLFPDWTAIGEPLVIGSEVFAHTPHYWLQWNGIDWDTLSVLPSDFAAPQSAIWIPGKRPVLLPDFVSVPPHLYSSLDRGRTWQELMLTFPNFVSDPHPDRLWYDPYRARIWTSTSNGPYYLDASELPSMQTPLHFKPADFTVLSAYPNPFNNTTRIRYDLDRRSKVQIQVFDLQGRLVTTLADDVLDGGRHELNWNAENLGSGTYFVRLQTAQNIRTEKLLLLK